MARIVELIETEATRGEGVNGDPICSVTQYWTREGILLFEDDTNWRGAVERAKYALVNHGYMEPAARLREIQKDIVAGKFDKPAPEPTDAEG